MNRHIKGAMKPMKPVDIDNVEDPSKEDLSFFFLTESFGMKGVVTMHQKLRQLIHGSVSGTVCLWLFTRRKAFNAKKDAVWY